MEKKEQLITIPLSDFLHSVLQEFKSEGFTSGLENSRITKDVGIVLENLLKGTLQYKVEFNDWNGQPLDYPVLWRYEAWFSAYERDRRTKDYAEKERIKRWIEHKNVENLTRVLMKKQSLSENFARPLAYKLVKNGNMDIINLMGLDRLVQREEEL